MRPDRSLSQPIHAKGAKFITGDNEDDPGRDSPGRHLLVLYPPLPCLPAKRFCSCLLPLEPAALPLFVADVLMITLIRWIFRGTTQSWMGELDISARF